MDVESLRKGDTILIKEGIASVNEVIKEDNNATVIRVQLTNENKILDINENDIKKILSSFEILKKYANVQKTLEEKTKIIENKEEEIKNLKQEFKKKKKSIIKSKQ